MKAEKWQHLTLDFVLFVQIKVSVSIEECNFSTKKGYVYTFKEL